MRAKTKNPAHEKKARIVGELANLLKNKRTILLASIKNLPASEFQEISKKLRGKAIVKFVKKNIILRAIEECGDEKIKKIKEQTGDNVAILFSDIDCFELASELIENKSPAKAKIGQEAPNDIEIEAGPTDLTPGPAISELGALGIKTTVDKGKISIKEPKVIVKKGEKISDAAASIMNKLDIKPFSIGFIPLSAFDNREKKMYLEIKIDRKETLAELKKINSKSLAFAVGMGYISKDTIKFLIRKAAINEKSLGGFVKVREKNPEEKS
ncbi:MAG: 50S ribosomal protein L10 [Nanoarchaeota archaeon]